jgi:hypothetical protein
MSTRPYEDLMSCLDSLFNRVSRSIFTLIDSQRHNLDRSVQRSFKIAQSSERYPSRSHHKQVKNFAALEKFFSQKMEELESQIKSTLNNFFSSFEISVKEFISRYNKPVPYFEPKNLKEKCIVDVLRRIHSKSVEYFEQQNVLICGDNSGFVSVLDLNTYKVCDQIRVSDSLISNLKICEKNKTVIVTSNQSVTLLNLLGRKKLKKIKTVDQHDSLFALLPLEHLNQLYTSGHNLGISLWDMSLLKPRGRLDTNGHKGVGKMLYLPKYNWIVAGFKDGWIGCYDVRKRKQVSGVSTGYNQWYINHMSFSDSQDILFANVMQGRISSWKLIDGRLEFYKEIHFDGFELNNIVCTNNEQLFVYSSGNNRIQAFDVVSEHSMDALHLSYNLTFFKFIPCKNLLVLGSASPNKLRFLNSS